MKKFTKLFMGLSLPITPIAAALPLVSCGHNEMLNIIVHKGYNVTGYKLFGDLFKGKDFKIQFDFDDGWEKIDEFNTKIKCGDKLLVLNQDYTVEDSDTIAIRGSSINNVNITVNAEAGATLNKNSLSVEWKNIGPLMFVYPNDNILPHDLDVWGYLGDDETKKPGDYQEISYGFDENQYLVTHDGIILSKFDSEGYTFKYDKPESELPTAESFNILIDYGNGYVIKNLTAICSIEINEFKIKKGDDPQMPLTLKVGEKKWIEIDANPGASKIATWAVTADGPDENAEAISIGRFDGKVVAKEKGKCTVVATCVEKPELWDTWKVVVEE